MDPPPEVVVCGEDGLRREELKASVSPAVKAPRDGPGMLDDREGEFIDTKHSRAERFFGQGWDGRSIVELGSLA